MSQSMPQNYQEWRHCITEICGIPLTLDYIERRLKALNDDADHMTARFVKLYGEERRRQTLAWFEQARQELSS